ncbi:MAG: iron chelate uptake ABC transporter family permease subunit [Burkholderiales bacterium]
MLAALVVGAALAAAGAAYQSLSRNLLVSPDILGVSAGPRWARCSGSSCRSACSRSRALAFAFGLGAVALVYFTAAAVRGHDPILVLVLAGVVVGALLGAVVALLKYLADPYNQLPAITFWLLGSLAATNRDDFVAAAPLVLAALVPLWLLRWRINLLSLGDEEARALGVETGRTRVAVIACATLMTAAAVSIAGIVGWVGLLIPHFARLLVGPDFARLLPTAVVLGAAFLLGVDILARTAARIEIPLGVLTAFVGTPLFLAARRAAELAVMRLEARDLAFGYPGHPVGRGVTLAFAAGEVVCLLGPNGGGKTTSFKTVLGLLPAQGGAVCVDGADLATPCARRGRAAAELRPAGACRLLPFHGARRGADGAHRAPGRVRRAVAARPRGRGRRARAHGARRARAVRVTRISGGERQLALIARALAQEGRIVVMDEPTASLDFGNQVRVLEQVRAWRPGASASSLSTHDPDQAFLCADRVALFHRGTLLCADAPERAVTADHLRLVYGVEVRIETVADGAGGVRRVCVPRVADAR